MKLDKLIKQIELEKAPEDFTLKVMQQVENLPVPARKGAGELLNVKEKRYLILFLAMLSTLMYFAGTGIDFPTLRSTEFSPSKIMDLLYSSFSGYKLTIDPMFIVSLLAFAAICFLLVDMILHRKLGSPTPFPK